MGLLSWLTASFGRDLDQRVFGTEGVAHVTYDGPLGEPPLRVRVSILRGHVGEIELAVGPTPAAADPAPRYGERAKNQLDCRLEAGKRYREAELTITASIESASKDPLASLLVEILTEVSGASRNLQTFSVESRLDSHGHAGLKMVVRFTGAPSASG